MQEEHRSENEGEAMERSQSAGAAIVIAGEDI